MEKSGTKSSAHTGTVPEVGFRVGFFFSYRVGRIVYYFISCFFLFFISSLGPWGGVNSHLDFHCLLCSIPVRIAHILAKHRRVALPSRHTNWQLLGGAALDGRRTEIGDFLIESEIITYFSSFLHLWSSDTRGSLNFPREKGTACGLENSGIDRSSFSRGPVQRKLLFHALRFHLRNEYLQ